VSVLEYRQAVAGKSVVAKIDLTSDLRGAWSYTSFMVLSSETERAASPAIADPMARIWEKGQLSISQINGNELTGELVFGPIVLNLLGRLIPVTDATPAIVEVTARRQLSRDETNVYELLGWVLPDPTGKSARPTIRGSVTVSKHFLDFSKNNKPQADQVGAFVLSPIKSALSEVTWINER
jgi:hypothetical protein